MRDMSLSPHKAGRRTGWRQKRRTNRVDRERRALIGLPEIRQGIRGEDMADFPIPEPMRRALDLARIAADWGEVPVGAVVVKEGEIGRAHAERQSLTRITYAVLWLKKKKK